MQPPYGCKTPLVSTPVVYSAWSIMLCGVHLSRADNIIWNFEKDRGLVVSNHTAQCPTGISNETGVPCNAVYNGRV